MCATTQSFATMVSLKKLVESEFGPKHSQRPTETNTTTTLKPVLVKG